MKPKDIVNKIAKSTEYCRLVELWSSENGNGEQLPSEKIVKVFQILSRRIDHEKKSLLCSFGLRPQANIITFKVPQHVQVAKDEFDEEVNKQMPVFIDLMGFMPIRLMNVMPIQVSSSD